MKPVDVVMTMAWVKVAQLELFDDPLVDKGSGIPMESVFFILASRVI
jgi:hypothetical protein